MKSLLCITVVIVVFASLLPAEALVCWVCENQPTNEKCIENGKALKCQINEDACQNVVRRGSFGMKVTKRCKQALACDNNYAQNPRSAWFPSQCNSVSTSNSVCRCCCGFDECNKKQLECLPFRTSTSQGLQDVTTPTPPPRCVAPREPVNGNVDCLSSPQGGVYELGVTCQYSCNNGFVLEGPQSTVCRNTARGAVFNPLDPPICRATPTCIPPTQPQNGGTECRVPSVNGRYAIGAVCDYFCNDEYILEGDTTTTCGFLPESNFFAIFSPNPPSCRSVPTCSPPAQPANGNTLCDDEPLPSGRYSLGSACEYRCNRGFEFVRGTITRTECRYRRDTTRFAVFSPRPTVCRTSSSCAPPERVANAQIDCRSPVRVDSGRFAVGSVCNYQCLSGSTLVGSNRRECVVRPGTTTAVFTPASPSCRFPTCSRPARPRNGRIVGCVGGNGSGRFRLRSQCSFACNAGYTLRGDQITVCGRVPDTANAADFTPRPPTCILSPTCPRPDNIEGGRVSCSGPQSNVPQRFAVGTVCIYECFSGGQLIGSGTTTCSIEAGGSTASFTPNPPTCRTPTCTHPGRPVNGRTSCDNNPLPNGRFPQLTLCRYTCNTGYTLNGARSTICTTRSSGSGVAFTESPPTCQRRFSCQQPNAPQNGRISCSGITVGSRFAVGSECIYVCNQGHVLNGARRSSCEILPGSNREAVFTPRPPTCTREATCEQPERPAQSGLRCSGPSTPTLGRVAVGTICIYNCVTGYALEGSDTITCAIRPGTNIAVFTPDPPRCRPPSCREPEDPENGGTTCNNRPLPNGRYPLFTFCRYTCNTGYTLIGVTGTSCTFRSGRNGAAFSTSRPFCRPPPPTCGYPGTPTNGETICRPNPQSSGRYSIGSVCYYRCNQGYYLEERVRTRATCRRSTGSSNSAAFTVSPPECRRGRCESIDKIRNGAVNCTNGNEVDSVCHFSCRNGFIIHPSSHTTAQCRADQRWTRETPCCLRDCPPNAFMDLVIVLDSSSSIKATNWRKMLEFTTDLIDNFNVGRDSARVGVFRYNNKVDTNTQILLNRYPNNKRALLQAIERIPYNGDGTLTGRALRYARNTMFTRQNGDRAGALNVLLVITDGVAQDGPLVISESNQLRAGGVATFALGIVAPGGLDMHQILSIAGSPERMIVLQKGFSGLDRALARLLSDNVCTSRSCEEERALATLNRG